MIREPLCSATVDGRTPLNLTWPPLLTLNPQVSDPFTLRVLPSDTPIVLTKLRLVDADSGLSGRSYSWPGCSVAPVKGYFLGSAPGCVSALAPPLMSRPLTVCAHTQLLHPSGVACIFTPLPSGSEYVSQLNLTGVPPRLNVALPLLCPTPWFWPCAWAALAEVLALSGASPLSASVASLYQVRG